MLNTAHLSRLRVPRCGHALLPRPPRWTGPEAQDLPGASCRLDWVIVDRLQEICGGKLDGLINELQRLLASATDEGDQQATVFWRCHLAAVSAESCHQPNGA